MCTVPTTHLELGLGAHLLLLHRKLLLTGSLHGHLLFDPARLHHFTLHLVVEHGVEEGKGREGWGRVAMRVWLAVESAV